MAWVRAGSVHVGGGGGVGAAVVAAALFGVSISCRHARGRSLTSDGV